MVQLPPCRLNYLRRYLCHRLSRSHARCIFAPADTYCHSHTTPFAAMEGKAGDGRRNMRAFDSFRLTGASADTAEADELKGQFDLLSEGRAVIRADDIRKASGRRGSVVNELSSLLTECQALRDGMNFEMFSSVMTQRQASTSIAGDNEMLAMFVSYDQGRCSFLYTSVHGHANARRGGGRTFLRWNPAGIEREKSSDLGTKRTGGDHTHASSSSGNALSTTGMLCLRGYATAQKAVRICMVYFSFLTHSPESIPPPLPLYPPSAHRPLPPLYRGRHL